MTAWPMVRLGDVLEESVDAVPVDPSKTYPISGVYSFGRGLFPRPPLAGNQTTYKVFHRLHTDDLVMSQLKAWEGAIARVTPEFDGWYLSPQFVTFRAKNANPRYAEWFCKQPSVWTELLGKSRGMGASRDSVSPARFLSISIPLPRIEEQRRVVEGLDRFAGRYVQVLRLRRESQLELDALCRSILFSNNASPLVPMADLVSLRTPDTRVERDKSYSFAGVYCFGKGVFKSQTKGGTEFAYDRLTKIHSGEFTYPKLMAWEGALGVVPAECDGLFVSPEYPVFTINSDKVLPEVLDVYYRTPSVWPILAGASTGTNVRRRRLHPSAFLGLRMPVPPMSVQQRMRKARLSFERVAQIRRGSEGEMKALLSAVLNHAFSGQL